MKEQILNEITLYCRDECGSSDCCPEEECVLFRIERMVDGKMKYKVFIEETVCDFFEVEASSSEEAEEIARKKYSNCEFVLEPGEVTSKQMMIEEPTGMQTEWFEF